MVNGAIWRLPMTSISRCTCRLRACITASNFRGSQGLPRVMEKSDFSALPTMRGAPSLGRTLVLAGSFDRNDCRCLHRGRQAQRTFIPPYGTGASLYLRPVMFGTTVGLGGQTCSGSLADRLLFARGCLFQIGGIKPIPVAIDREQDRAAPRGTGDVKVGGNYAASLLSGEKRT